jgi:hypothetical protein
VLELKLQASATEYKPVTVNYPGFAENLDTVAILPTLVSYDFSQKPSPYFQRRCGELARIGEMVRSRLEELRATGHKQWRATTWEMKAGNWQKDSCFFGTAKQQVASDSGLDVKPPSQPQSGSRPAVGELDVREAQKILKQLGYYSGTADGMVGPLTKAALKQFQTAQGMTPNGKLNVDLLTALQVRGKPSN